MTIKKVWRCLLALSILGYNLNAQSPKTHWVDSVFSQMTQADKIGQLFIITIPSGQNPDALADIESKIKVNGIGGIFFTGHHTLNQADLINRFQSLSKIPLLIVSDPFAENKNPDSVLTFPSPLALGALADDSLIYQLGKETARQQKLMGVQMDFIPANLTGSRNNYSTLTFGENRFIVAEKSLAFWKGLQDGGVIACARNFPVEGVRVTNVQKGVPDVQLNVDSLEAYPFKMLVKNGLPALMPASSKLPLFYPNRKTALKNIFSSGTLTAAFAGKWIRRNMDYGGVIIVEVQDLLRSSTKFSPGAAEVFAFQSGNDMLLTASNIGAALRKMRRLLRREKEYRVQLDSSVKKILAMKYDAGLSARQPVQKENLLPKMFTRETKVLQEKIYNATATVISNERNALPIQSLENKQFICVAADDSLRGSLFARNVSKYVRTNVLNINAKTDTLIFTDTLQPQQVIIAAVFPGTKDETLRKLLPVLKEPQINREVIICDFGSVAFRKYAAGFPTVITAYSDKAVMLKSIPQVIFGALPANGILPIAYGRIPPGTSASTRVLGRLGFSFPEAVGIDGKTLEKIKAIADEAIGMHATPGCQVLVAKDGKVVYQKSFGYLTYEKQSPVTDETIYDLASLTKVSATLQAVMFMYEKGLIDINKKASVYLPMLKNSNKEDFILKDILTHQSGLWPYLPFYALTMQDTSYLPEYYSRTPSPQYPYVVADRLYASVFMKDSLWSWIIHAKIREKPDRTPYDYRYSDMGFYILQHLAEKILNQPLQDFLYQNVYEPLGAYTTGYRPLLRFPIRQIAPTENDKVFRKTLLIGTVHDQGAAMQGGVAGHAGLFSDANDLAKLGQMLLQEGYYGGIRYYKPETVRFFTKKQFENSRRGLGWDKPTGSWNSPTSVYASPETFGHTGFTGTCMWIDPEFNLVYVFLSNRVHPDMTNNKLITANIRSRIQDVIYEAIFNYCKSGGNQLPLPAGLPFQALGSLYNK